MRHVATEHLAGRALGESPPLSPVECEHLVNCVRCSTTVEDLRTILAMSTDPASPAYAAAPDPRIWLEIKSRLGTVKQLPRKRESAASLRGDG